MDFNKAVDNFMNGEGLKRINKNVRSAFGFLSEDGTLLKEGYTMCHATMGSPANQTAILVNIVRDAPSIFYNWITDPEVSPWRDLLRKNFSLRMITDDRGAFFLGDLEHNGQFLSSFMKAGRLFTEHPNHGVVFTLLSEKGVHPTIAYYIAQCFTTDGKGSATEEYNWHGGIFDPLSNFASFLHGAYNAPYDGRPYGAYNAKWVGVDSIWSNGQVKDVWTPNNAYDRIHHAKAQAVAGRWYKPKAAVKNWTFDDLITLAQTLKETYGVADYKHDVARAA